MLNYKYIRYDEKLFFTLLLTGSFTALHAQDICIEVYHDQNGNGIMEDTETGMEGINLALTSAPASFTGSLPYGMVTDVSGISCLTNVGSGEYGFFVNLPEGYAVTNQPGPSFIIEVTEENVVNSYRIGLSNQLAVPAYGKAAFTVYPNPAAITISFKNIEEDGEVTIYDISGKQLLTNEVNAENTSIDISSLSKGVYIAKISSGNKTETLRFIVSN